MKREDTRQEFILGGSYCLLRLLQRRPRLNLYLGRGVREQGRKVKQATLVAVRELLLDGLTTAEREQVEHAAFQEFVSPLLPGSTRLSTSAGLQRVEGERHYTIIHLDHISDSTQALAQASVLTLDDLLQHKLAWPRWLDKRLALRWGMQLARLVARLHHAGVVLGDLSPSTVLVDDGGLASWAPLLLPSWPPPQCYWQHPTTSPWRPQESVIAPLHISIFPPGRTSTGSPFAAPETLRGECYLCSDVYSLGAILYLLLAHHAPPTALRRTEDMTVERLELPSLQLFEHHHTENLDAIIQRTLALEPDERYDTVFELVEALEGVESEL